MLEFRLLGPVEAYRDGTDVDLGPARQRAVLAVLLLEVNRVVTAAQLEDRIWPDNPPQRARRTLHSYLSRLRGILSPDVEVARRSGGYVLSAAPETIDLHRFRQLVAHPGTGTEVLDEALGLWGGAVCEGITLPWFDTVRTGVSAEHDAAYLDRNDLLLERGQAARLLPELSTVTPELELNERRSGQLMRALYQCGRQADALAEYQRLRFALVEQLGSEPGPPLRQLHQRILSGDPALSPAPESRTPVPRQLPPGPTQFIGRTAELAELDEQRPSIRVLSGAGGIGKTWLALHWAHQHLDRFPDGQLYVNLRGFDPFAEPVAPHDALGGFLRALDVPTGAVPASPDDRAALYRSLLAGRRVLIMLDNARDTAQVESLLPGTADAQVLVTCRNALPVLLATTGARHIELSEMDEPDARAALATRLGDARLAAEPEATAGLIASCGGLPLALGILAARAASRPRLPLSALAEELHDTTTRLDSLDTEGLSSGVRAALAGSHRALGPEAARTFRLLGRAGSGGISRAAIVSLTGRPAPVVRKALAELETAHLLGQYASGRYRMHDLVSLYAAELAVDADEEAAALRRFVEHFAFTTLAETKWMRFTHHSRPNEAPVDGVVPEQLTDDTVVDWFRGEYDNLRIAEELADRHHFDKPLWMLCRATTHFQQRQGLLADQLTSSRRWLRASERLDDARSIRLALRVLAQAQYQAGEGEPGLTNMARALELAIAVEDTQHESDVLQSFTWILSGMGRHREALDRARQGLDAAKRLGDDKVIAGKLNLVGWCLAQVDELAEARAHCVQALELLRHDDNRLEVAHTQDSLGYIAYRTGDLVTALSHYDEAVAEFDDVGHEHAQADSLTGRGAVHADLGRTDAAREDYRRALRFYRSRYYRAAAGNVEAALAKL